MLRRSGPTAVAFALLVINFATFSTSPAGAVEVQRHEAKAQGGVVYIDGVERWRGQGLSSGLAWSERHDALAFAGWDRSGEARLVVLIVDDELEPTVIIWTVPAVAQPARTVTWLGLGRIGAGPDELNPKMIAEYSLGH
jgi:hypothetical protein